MAQEEETWEFDPWSTSSGLPDQITVRFDNPHFGYDAQINDGQTCLFIPEGTIIAGTDDGGSGEFNQFYSCGDAWEPANKGARVVREDGKKKPINQNSNYGRLFTSLINAAKEQGLEDQLRKLGTPFDAATWKGIEAYMERVHLPSFTGRDGKLVEREALLVKRIEKLPGAKVSNTNAVKAAPAEDAGPAASTNGSSESGGGIDPKTLAKIRAVARTCDTHEQFVERGLDVPGVLDDPALEQLVMDDGAGSVWSSVKEEANA